MPQTKVENLVNPQVMKDMISAKLEKAIRFAPLARIDRTLVGQPGNTVTVPRFEYIGDAEDVAEGVAMGTAVLTTSTQQATIKKAGKALELTDESVLSGYGDPVGEAENQLLLSIANKIDNDALEALGTTTLVSGKAGDGLTVTAVEAAQDIFEDEDDKAMVLIVNPKDATKLRNDAAADFTRASALGDSIVVTGVFGEVLGAQIVRSRKVAEGTGYLVKAGALAIYLKRDALVESDRDILKKTTVISADEHYGVVLEDESKAVKLTF